MARFDMLRLSLLTAVTACGPAGITDGSDGADTNADADTNSSTDAETGGEACSSCEGAVEIANGFVQCSDGAINRVAADKLEPGEDPGACTSDSDCIEGWACIPPGLVPGTGPFNACQLATCTSNADCGPCGECGLGAYDDGCGYVITLKCRTAGDTCRADADCGLSACFPASDTWACHGHQCDIGRPLLVDDVARTAALRRRADWSVAFELPEDAELARHWAKVGALEHASVASFARFALQLMALGAPPQLLRATQQAARDEIEHAKLAYGLASAYGGAQVGPARLDLTGVTLTGSWREVVGALIDEACVGETLGVAEALVTAEHITDPAQGPVRAVLERIVADELRHAQLAWRALAWLLREAGGEDRRWALGRLERTIAGLGRTRVIASDPGRPAEGVLGATERGELHRQAVVEVLEPLARALAA